MEVVKKGDPKISVLLPVYNGEKYIAEAVSSILAQSETDFELMIIDDCSSDSTPDLLKVIKDPRVSVFRNERNIGLTRTLNRGLSLARGEYIARMDADDICFRERFSLQLDLMEQNKRVCVCGGSFKKTGSDCSDVVKELDDDTLKGEILLRNPFAHPFVMFRGGFIRQNRIYYDEAYSSAQDYELWLRLAHEFDACLFANVPYFLGLYRDHDGSVSALQKLKQRQNASKARMPYLIQLCGDISAEEISIHDKVYEREYQNISPEKFLLIKAWLLKLRERNQEMRKYPCEQFETIIARKFKELCINNLRFGKWVVKQLLIYPYPNKLVLSKGQIAELEAQALHARERNMMSA